MSAWLLFALSGSVVAAAGSRLARDGDTIAEGTGLGGMWVGAVLVAGATSVPELATNVSAVLVDSAQLAIGDLFGSNMFNMLILAVADLVTRQSRVLTRVAVNQALVGALSVLLTALAAVGVVGNETQTRWPMSWVTAAIGAAYLGGMVMIHGNRPEPPFRTKTEVASAVPTPPMLRRAIVRFAIGTLVILVAAPYLVASTTDLGAQLGISEGFAGMVFLAAATSLPEAAVSYSAVRAGSYNLAVGNLLGSNCFNMVTFALLDLVDGPGSLLGGAHPGLVVSALAGILLVSLSMLDLFDRAERRVWVVEPVPALMVATYAMGLYLTYVGTAP